MVLSVFLHMARVFYHGAYKPPREFNWVIGVVLLTLTLLLSFTGYLLPWDQLALWAVTVGTNMMGYTPVFGDQVRFVLLGGAEIGTDTLLRWYVLHVLMLPFVIVIFMAVHFWRVRKDGGISGPLEPPLRARRTADDRDPRTPPQAGRRGQGQGRGQQAGGDAPGGRRRARGRPRPTAPPPRRRPAAAAAGSGARGGPAAPAATATASPSTCSTATGRRRRTPGWPGPRPPPVARSPPPRPAAGRHRSGRAHPAAADRRQVRLHPGRQGHAAGQGPHLAPPAGGRVRGRPARSPPSCSSSRSSSTPRCWSWPTPTRRRTRPRRRGTSWASRSCSRCSTRWSPA